MSVVFLGILAMSYLGNNGVFRTVAYCVYINTLESPCKLPCGLCGYVLYIA